MSYWMEEEIIRDGINQACGVSITKRVIEEPPPVVGGNVFTIRKCREWMDSPAAVAMPKMLFGGFWFEDELCIMFADTNSGKSVLAVQIGDSLSKRTPIEPFNSDACNNAVLYIDFELDSKQFGQRYAANRDRYLFSDNFYRAEFNTIEEGTAAHRNYEYYINGAIEYAVKKTKARTVIIDNITCLRHGTEKAADALPLMNHLKALKFKYKLSILVLAHTPKRNNSKPITRDDLQGSKMLINFCDSAFAIGESCQRKNLRYLKQIKQRSAQQQYGADNVCLFRIEKPDNFLQFTFEGYDHEQAHLRSNTREELSHLAYQITAMDKDGASQRQISAKLGVSVSTVNKYLKKEKVAAIDESI